MKYKAVTDAAFQDYGAVIPGEFDSLLSLLREKPCPQESTMYAMSDDDLERAPAAERLRLACFGGLPTQIGYCNGHNQVLTCLEYHASSELNLAADDVILLVGKRQHIRAGKYHTDQVEAFLLPAGVCVELYATTLHYSPCGVDGNGFRVAVVLPKGTNGVSTFRTSDPLMAGKNKWMMAHPDSMKAKFGAYIGLIGKNIVV